VTDAAGPAGGWAAWLSGWNEELLAGLDLERHNAFVDPARVRPLAERGWLGAPPATEAELGALEARLGIPLPPSYRSFLAASNGFVLPGCFVPALRSTESVEWLREAMPDLLDAYANADAGDDAALLQAALLISEQELVGTAVYLLDPRRPDADGEWSALLFAHWAPGAEAHRSFLGLLEAERANARARGAGEPCGHPDGPGAGRLPARNGLRDLLRWIFR
jgi:hypothetical protein